MCSNPSTCVSKLLNKFDWLPSSSLEEMTKHTNGQTSLTPLQSPCVGESKNKHALAHPTCVRKSINKFSWFDSVLPIYAE